MIKDHLIPPEVYNQLDQRVFDLIDQVDLLTQATYLFLARSDPRKSVIASRGIELYPHQIGAVQKILQEPLGRGGILADEVGLGKTIEAGLLIKEYLCRAAEEGKTEYRILILVPSSLLKQWQNEMKDKIGEDFLVYDRKTRKQLKRQHENIWLAYPKIICSIDTAKRPEYRKKLDKISWDLVVIDEAHRLRNEKTLAHQLGRALQTKRLLLLTATPLQNSLTELYNLITLIDRRRLGNLGWKRLFRERLIENEDRQPYLKKLSERIKQILVRNRRENLIGIQKGLHPVRRNVNTLEISLSRPERQLYDAVTDYVRKEYQKSKETRSIATTFRLISFQRRLCSSAFAIRDSLRNRIEKLENILNKRETIKTKSPNSFLDIDLEEDDDFDLDWQEEQEILMESKSPEDSDQMWQEIQNEIVVLKKLLKFAEAIKQTTKGQKLLRAITRIPKSEKIIIFTEFISTQNYISDLLDKNGFQGSYELFNGRMSPQAKEKAIKNWIDFKRILISTDSGSEGKNLQIANYLFNYDLPWNPMRVEQRIGRIDRIGQTRDVNIFNFITKNTIEERVLTLLGDKLDLFHQVIGGTGLILGSIKEGKYLERMILELLMASTEEFMSFSQQLEKARLSFLGKMEQMEKTWKYFDLGSVQDSMGVKQWEEVLKEEQPKIKWFFQRFIDYLGIRHFMAGEDIYEISTPDCFADLIPRETIWFTFNPEKIYDRDYIEFITYGNQLFNRSIHFVLQKDKRISQKTISSQIAPFDRPFLLFNFRTRFESLDLIEDEWFALAIEPTSGEIREADIVNWAEPNKSTIITVNFTKEHILNAGRKIDRYLKAKIGYLAENKLKRNEALFTEEMKLLREYNIGWKELFSSFEQKWQKDYQNAEHQLRELKQQMKIDSRVVETDEMSVVFDPEETEDLEKQIEQLSARLQALDNHYKNQRRKFLHGEQKLKEEVETLQETLEERVKLNIEVEFISALVITPF
ncbi:MAG: SNF2-related protein [Promethearchaeota archaeon]